MMEWLNGATSSLAAGFITGLAAIETLQQEIDMAEARHTGPNGRQNGTSPS